MFKKIRLLIFILFFLVSSALSLVCTAQVESCKSVDGFCNPAGSETSWTPEAFAGRTIKYFIGIVGILALVLFIWAGFLWMTAGGEAKQVQTAQHMLVWTTLGLFLIFGSYIIVNFVLGEINF